MRVLYLLAAVAVVLSISGCDYYDQPGQIDCETITDRAAYEDCLYNKSVYDLNAVGCRDIMDADRRAQCIDEVSIAVLDYFPCRQHDRMSQRDACEAKVGEARRAARNEE
ncbi:MAG: hypothetical protein GF416_04170 [Candidatus Altiarchaeales archaeon]|nr:hypothetical protein [Candidatus Altiarchaeales archaeon]MBD3416316.1 hypothetical protein [Candidatus Altiarchaeales archaeon]